jgi:hypothetical protein
MQYRDMVAGLLAQAEGCPEIEAVRCMRNACIEWCRETYSLTSGSVLLTGQGGGVPAPVVMTGLYIVDVVSIRIAGEPVDWVQMNSERTRDATATEPVVVGADPASLQVVPAPTAPTLVDLLIAVAPGPASEEVPDVLWLHHHEALEHGALARLLALPKKPWTDPATATWHGVQFQEAMTKAAALNGRNRFTQAQRLRVKPA